MCAAQSNPQQSFGYTWGFADNARAESVLEISPNINYTVSSESVSKIQQGKNILVNNARSLVIDKTEEEKKKFMRECVY